MPHAFPKLIHVSPVSVPMWVQFKRPEECWSQPVISWGLVESEDGHRWLEPLVGAQKDGKCHAVYAQKAARESEAEVVGLFRDSDGKLEA